ncbi:MAG: type II secretion system F family protein [Pseudomonadota bacterium]
MRKFTYKALNENGNPITGVLEAESVEMVNNILTSRGYIPSKVMEADGRGQKGGITLLDRLASIRATDMILFSKQLGTMVRAGVPIIRLFQVLESQTENRKLKRIIAVMLDDIQQGRSLAEAFGKHPEAFSPLYCSMLQAGEASGTLPEVLDRLIYIIEHEHKVKSEVKSALTYPAIVVFALVTAFFVLLTFVIPKFVMIFIAAKIELPLPTRAALALYQFLVGYWPFLLVGLLVSSVGLGLFMKTPRGRLYRDNLLLHLPILGQLFVKSAMSRFASIFSILQASGVSVLDGMQILSRIIGNAAIAREFDGISEQLREGKGIAAPLKSARYFTPMVINIVAIGEESGNLDTMLREVSMHYDAEVEFAAKRLADAIGPLLTVGLAAIVGFFALAIFLPMWDLTKMVR